MQGFGNILGLVFVLLRRERDDLSIGLLHNEYHLCSGEFVQFFQFFQDASLAFVMIVANVVPRPPRTEMVKQKRSRVKGPRTRPYCV